MKYRQICWFAGVLACVWLAACGSMSAISGSEEQGRAFVLSWPEEGRRVEMTQSDLEALGAVESTSAYFDRAMSYRNSRFRSISFETLLNEYPPGVSDAVLLNCFDDYQGLLTLEDIQRYRLSLATHIQLTQVKEIPDWLRPLLILVPDKSAAPFQERFMTANIRELQFVQRDHYYAPLDQVAKTFPETSPGLQTYKDNCVYCHSIKGVGGNKGGSLFKRFDFSKASQQETFKKRFLAFHHKDNADKQNVEQFVNQKRLQAISRFLVKTQRTYEGR